MATTNLNIRTDKEVKEKAEAIFSELGLTMTTAVNMFLRSTIRENGISFDLKLDSSSNNAMSAIGEERQLVHDSSEKGYSDKKEG